MSGDMESIAGALKRIESRLQDASDARLDSFKGLLSSIESSLADVLEVISAGGGEAALKTMADALRDMKLPEVKVEVKAPQVNVQPANVTVEAVIPPAPQPILHFLPAPEKDERPKAFKLVIQGANGGPDRQATITPIY